MNINQSAMCYISMDSSQRALQTNENHFFKLVFEILAEETKNILKNIEAWIFIQLQYVITGFKLKNKP